MAKTRLQDRPEDYVKRNVNPDHIEIREDGKRDDSRPGAFEWWYFDAVLDDGTKVVVYYGDKNLETFMGQGPFPYCEIQVTEPDGTYHHDCISYPTEQGSFSTEQCDVQVGPHRLRGDLKEYQVLICPEHGLGIDFKLKNLGSSWRPGTAYFSFGEEEQQYFTWFCAVPRGTIEGTLTIDGKERKVTGYGYHDHQWGNLYPSFAWNHWIWARQNFGDYNILLFDFVAAPAYDGDRYTVCFVQDKDGNTIFEHYKPAKFEVFEEYTQEESGKDHPKHFKYTLENKGKTVEYSLESSKELEVRDDTKLVNEDTLALMEQMGLHPTYTRFFGNGSMMITDGEEKTELSGELIYEMVYSGKTYKI